MDNLAKDATVSDVHSPGALGPDGRRKRRILRALRIDEISAVDFPAQAHARALIIKRHAPDEAETADDDLTETELLIAKRAAEGESYFAAVTNVFAERIRMPNETIEKAKARFHESEKGRYLRAIAKQAPASWYAKPDPRNKTPGPGQHAPTNTMARPRKEDMATGPGQHAPTNTPAKPREEDKAPTTGFGARPKDGEARKALASRAAELMASDKRLTREAAVARIAESRFAADQAIWRAARNEARA